ncbi:SDR family NAD(P)-dependent oxidoreductase [Stutzerimonas stutzeri]|uniref:SDR family NAD(P)-dependent oxidoreductase n=1 Tax=Stutzerimonas stutzeri TaxID=316 RepID=UPI002657D6DD|nr:SDR family NAD(P)-dependent oxidoreductase [Stutzerimonas stutzeri]MCF6782709.1 SDR family oxidoreductase [Stutzerimonas stutzeri]MCF6805814.1 SDR family oxidoreductase [Stutzerimonas stutzeri]
MKNTEFKDRFAVITGASSGIGLALCTELLQRGARVLAMSRSVGGLKSLLEIYAEKLHWLEGDVTSRDDLQALARRAAQLGPVDYLVPNAGIAELGDSLDMSAFDRQWAVNGAGALNTLGALRNELARPASVVFVGTFLTSSTFAGLAAYIASKAALVAQARTLAVEFAPLGVRINIVSPGPTATAIWGTLGLSDEQFEQVAEMVGKRLLPGHFLESAAVANVILFQLSQGARGVYGQDWVVDNGYTLN